MKKQPKISVIVAIYGNEKYLHQCVQSILDQTLTDIEVILMDDGSIDKSPAICDEFAQKDKRVRVVHKKNSGYGDNVNQGIALAKGQYIGIVEGDDFIEPDMYEKLYHQAVRLNSDVVKCNFYLHNSAADPTDVPYPHLHTDLPLVAPLNVNFEVKDHPALLTYHSSVWATLYRADFTKSIKLRTTPGATYQDFPFMFEVLVKAKRVSVLNEYLLHYRLEDGQNSSTKKPGKNILYLCEHANYIKEILLKENLWNIYKEVFYYHVTNCLRGYFHITDPQYKSEFYKRLRQFYLPLLKDKTFSYQYFDSATECFVKWVLADRQDILLNHRTFISKLKRFYHRIISFFILNKKTRKKYKKIYVKD